MRIAGDFIFVLAVAALSMVPMVLGCTDSASRACGLAGCSSSATVRGYATLKPDEMGKAVLIACRNGTCAAGTPKTLPNAPGEKLQFDLSGPLPVSGFISSPDAKGYKIEVVFSIDDQTARDSDRYDLTINRADGNEVNSYGGTGVYEDVTPNGRDCPPLCRTTTIEQT